MGKDILDALTDTSVVKWAFNAQFERICLSRYLKDLGVNFDGKYLNPSSWHCTLVWSATLGLPLSLEGVGAVLGLENKRCQRVKISYDIFVFPVPLQKSIMAEQEIYHIMIWQSGVNSRHTIFVMLKPR